nr:hypothetical protein [Tanacetum cinerariifolium]
MAVGRPPLNTIHKSVHHLSPPQPLPINISVLEPINNRDSAPHNVDGDHHRFYPPVIPILSDSSDESVASHAPRVILFGTIPNSIPVILVVPAEVPIEPADPIVAPEDSFPVAPELPLVLPFLYSDDSEADSSSSDSLSNSSSVHSARCDASGQSHLGPLTRVASPRLVDSPVRTPLYSFSPSAGQSRKRCKSPTTLVPSSTPVSRSIAPVLADLPPRKRFRDSYSSEVSVEEHMEIDTADAETIADLGIGDGFRAPTKDGIVIGVEVANSDIREDGEEFESEANAGGMMEIVVDPLVTSGIFKPTGGDAPDLEGTLYDIAHYMSEVPLDRIIEFETAQRQLEADRVDNLHRYMELSQEEFHQICKDRDDTRRRLRRLESLVERRMTNTHSGMTPAAIKEMNNRRVTEALKTREANRNIGLGNGNDKGGNINDNGNENRGGNGNGNHNENYRDARLVV